MSADFQIPQAYQPVAAIGVDARASFINRTYNHLMGAIVLFTLIEVGLFQSGYAESIASDAVPVMPGRTASTCRCSGV